MAESEGFELSPTGDTTGAERPRRGWPRWWPLLPLGLAALLLVILVAQKPAVPLAQQPPPTETSPPATLAGTPTVTSPRSPTPSLILLPGPTSGARVSSIPGTPGATPPPTTTSAVRQTRVGKPILGITADWELFAAGPQSLVRIQPAKGLLTVTRSVGAAGAIPGQLRIGVDTGQVLVTGDGMAGVGYLVPDGRPATPLPVELASVQQLWPGPGSGQWWANGGQPDPPWTARVVRLDSGATGRTVRVPADSPAGVWTGDGDRGLLYTVDNQIYRVDSDGPMLLHHGTLLAVGRNKLLIDDCDEQLRCGMGVLDGTDGHWQPVPAISGLTTYGVTAMSGDGRFAVADLLGEPEPDHVLLIDLTTGDTRKIAIAIGYSAATMVAFAPDDSWLFLADSAGKLHAVDVKTGREHPLGIDLPKVSAIAIRPGATS